MYLCVRVSLPSMYQAQKVSGHVFVKVTRPGKCGHVFCVRVSLPNQESDRVFVY